MKNKKLFILSMLLMIVGNILADNISVNDITLSAGEEKQIAINLTNTENNYVAFQFDLVLPAGVTVAKDNKGRFVASITEERNIDHTLTVGDVGSNTFRFLSYSGTNSEFYGKEGALLNITLKADESFGYGDFTATIVNPKFTLSSGTKVMLSETSFKISNPKQEDPIITITAKDVIRKYGEANPTLGYTVQPEGSSLNGVPDINCVATTTSPVGQYEIVVSRGSITNENVVFVNGTLKVQKAPLTIKADDKQMKQGEPLPEFTATYTGFKNSETEAVLKKKPKFNCTATSDSPAGTYVIVPSSAEAQNYDITYVNGTLTIVSGPVPDQKGKLSAENIELNAGTEAKETFSLSTFGNKYVAFQFDLNLPNGITIAKDEKGRFVANLEESRCVDHTLNVGEVGTNAYRILSYSGTNAEFSGNSGAIMSIQLKSDNSMKEGKYDATITNMKFTLADGTKHSFDDTSFAITIKSGHDDIITITNGTAGKLSSQIMSAGYQSKDIESMKVVGSLNGTDIKLIREMILDGKLTVLDIKNCNIVSGGEAYYNYEDIIQYYTKNDIIGSGMFEDCKGLMVLNLPSSAKKIESLAIYGCDNLKTLDLPEFCEEIGPFSAISDCKRLEQINIYSRLHTIGAFNFSSCPNFREFNVVENNNWYCSKEGVLFSKDEKELLVYPMGKTNIGYLIPVGTEQIGTSAFESAILHEVFIPNSINRVGEYAFAFCQNLKSVWSYIWDINNVEFARDYFGEVNAFEYMPSECTWYVITGTSGDYTNKDWWVESWKIDDPNNTRGIIPHAYLPDDNGAWYTLQGVKLDGKPTKPGIYVHGGRKIFIK